MAKTPSEHSNLLSINELLEFVPRRPCTQSIRRWIRFGVRGHKLRALKKSGRFYSSLAWLKEFLEATAPRH